MLSLTPKEIAEAIFTDDPDKPNSYKLFGDSVDSCENEYNYEILINIMMSGLDILSGGLSDNLADFSVAHIINLNPWFRSFGYEIKTAVFDKGGKEAYKNYYCRIGVKNALNEIFFNMQNIKDDFHFFKNGKYDGSNTVDLSDMFSIFEHSEVIYGISFVPFV